jgi:hypothetical protein
LALAASDALAFDCYVANKPAGAGAVTEAEIKSAGNSGQLTAPGAFIDTSVTGLPVDIFIRGGLAHEAREEEGIVGIGTLPVQPHCRGGAGGVQTIDPEKC